MIRATGTEEGHKVQYKVDKSLALRYGYYVGSKKIEFTVKYAGRDCMRSKLFQLVLTKNTA